MIERHLVFYVGSKVVAAVLNLASVALFTRLAGPSGYGDYLVAFAWAYVVYGWSAQWLPPSFFAQYTSEESVRLVPTLYRLLAALLLSLAGLATLAGWLGWVDTRLAVKVVALVIGLAVYDAAIQIGRAKLSAGRVSLTIVLRGVLVLMLGGLALSAFKSAVALTLAVAVAQLLAILPILPVLRNDATAPGSRATALRYAEYGWPLMASFGTSSLGQNIDRLMLARAGGVALVGPYGAVGDLIRQSMVFISEAIGIAYIPLAKAAAANNDTAGARVYLVQAFRAYTAVFVFGGVVLLTFADKLIAVVLGPTFAAATAPFIPWFALAAGLSIFRNYYLGQIIYFSGSSRLELWASIATVSVTAGLAFLLIPLWSTTGAAIAMMAGQAAACAVFLLASLDAATVPLPLPWRDFLSISLWAVGSYAIALAIDRLGPDEVVNDVLEVIAIAVALWGAARVHNLMNFNDIMADLTGLAGRIGWVGESVSDGEPPSESAKRKGPR